MRKLTAMLMLLGLCACAVPGDRVRERVEKTLPAEGVTALHLRNTAGTISIEAWDKPQVRVEAIKTAPDTDTLKRFHVSVGRTGGEVDVVTQYDAGISRGGVLYTLMVPRAVNVQVENTAGTITLSGFSGDVTADAKAGTVEATMAKAGGNQHIALNATTGTVTLRIPKNSDATVRAQSTIGSFESTFPGLTRTQRHLVGSGADGTIGSGSATIDLTTTTGSIALRQT